jgi:hypothetical protein
MFAKYYLGGTVMHVHYDYIRRPLQLIVVTMQSFYGRSVAILQGHFTSTQYNPVNLTIIFYVA